ncbi:MAG: hypothetical protein AAFZ89_15745 [Bacteroidota bacterium]
MIVNIFFSMDRLPEKSANDPSVSRIVIVYDKTHNKDLLHNLGYYDFEISEWNHFGKESMQLICWCYVPNPSKFISLNDFEIALPRVYIPK